MEPLKFEVYLAKAITKSKTSKKPLLVQIKGKQEDNDKTNEWINEWIDEENLKSIAECNAAVLLKISNGNNANFQFFKNYVKNLSNFDAEEHESYLSENKDCLFILNNNSIQEVISDISDKEECNSILAMFISSYKDTPAKKKVEKPALKVVIQKEEKKQPKPVKKEKEVPAETKVLNGKSATSEAGQKYRKNLLSAQKEERQERERIRKLIEQDKLEKKERFQYSSTGIEEEVAEQENVQDHIHSKARLGKVKECKLSIKTVDNRNIIHSFKSEDSLDAVRKYLVETENIDNNFMFHRNVPRMTYKDIDEFKSLQELDLLPRSALILEPKHYSSASDNYFEAKNTPSGGIVNALYSWWNGNAEEQEDQEEQDETSIPRDQHKKDPKETYNGNTTNLIDPKDDKKY